MQPLLVASLFSLLPAVVLGECYYPDGSLATDFDYVPCTGGTFQTCCVPDDDELCLENGMCWYEGSPYRATCQDQTWGSSNCPQFCLTGESSDTFEFLYECGNSTYCCMDDYTNSDTTCCNDASLTFTLDDFDVVDSYGVSTTLTISEDTTIAPDPSSTSFTTTASGASTTTTSTSATTTGTSFLTETGRPDEDDEFPVLAVGLGVGIPVALLAAGGIFLAWFCIRKRSGKRDAAAAGPGAGMPPAGGAWPQQQQQQPLMQQQQQPMMAGQPGIMGPHGPVTYMAPGQPGIMDPHGQAGAGLYGGTMPPPAYNDAKRPQSQVTSPLQQQQQAQPWGPQTPSPHQGQVQLASPPQHQAQPGGYAQPMQGGVAVNELDSAAAGRPGVHEMGT
ncbi:hypothetical protein BDY21DRAFT_365141 [Lineolata rhizophorae]|uniref:Mid2 domain-containing protein n=1 Tax=Lineolata rhizophorae TaxID=578093 RepID=A0A6A6NWU2_9PEZI|nr:hypothetical protein BDY21DRAFT_365141 [Lineolata rhizophorae]